MASKRYVDAVEASGRMLAKPDPKTLEKYEDKDGHFWLDPDSGELIPMFDEVWESVTTEDLAATIANFPHTASAKRARAEWKRRFGSTY